MKIFIRHTRNRLRGGFTLIELLVVISVIGMLASIVLASVSAARDQARLAAAQEFDHNVYTGLFDNILAEYRFENFTGGSTILDSGPTGMNLSKRSLQSDPSISNDMPLNSGRSLELLQKNTAVYVSTASKQVPAINGLTLSFWMKTFSSNSVGIFSVTTATGNIAISISSSPPNRLSISGSIVNSSTYTAKTPVLDGKWHHILFSYNGQNQTGNLYIDSQATTVYNQSGNAYSSVSGNQLSNVSSINNISLPLMSTAPNADFYLYHPVVYGAAIQ